MRRISAPLAKGLMVLAATIGLAFVSAAAAEDAGHGNPERPYIRVTYTVETNDRVWSSMRSEYRETGRLPALTTQHTDAQTIPVGEIEYVSGPSGREKLSVQTQDVPINVDAAPASLRGVYQTAVFDGVNSIEVRALRDSVSNSTPTMLNY